MWRISTVLAVVVALGACGRSETGVHIVMRVGPLDYDELRLQVTRTSSGAGEQTIVDPATMGRYAGPFRPGDQDVIVYVRDDLDGARLHCEATALSAGAAVSNGASDVTVARGEITAVEIFMAPPTSPAGSAGTSGSAGTGGSPGTGGSVGGAGSAGTAGASGTGGTSPPRKGNGDACSLSTECLTASCVDGVCCESDCKMACRSCALADSKGLCRPVPAQTPDPRGMCNDKGAASCQTNGLCEVSGSCAVYPAGTPCDAAICADMNKSMQLARVCDGAGKCEAPVKIKCPAGVLCVDGVCP